MQKMFLRSGMQNMEYKVKFTEKCLEDIEEACQYIEEKLKAENTANRFKIKIKEVKS